MMAETAYARPAGPPERGSELGVAGPRAPGLKTGRLQEPGPKKSWIVRQEILIFLPHPVRGSFEALSDGVLESLLEIRLRAGRPVELVTSRGSSFLGQNGGLTGDPCNAYIFTLEDAQKTFQIVTLGSVYAMEEELKAGYITLKGGHRVGLAGRVITGRDGVPLIKDVSGFSFRIAGEVKGCADPVMPYCITASRNRVYSTLIVSPPRAGKTTLLRDMIRQASNGIPALELPGQSVGLVDERSEIAACYQGQPQNDVGLRTDVLDACPKARGIMMLIRSMSPDVVATDEIGRDEDVRAVEEALNAGVSVFATAHAAALEELSMRPAFKRLLEMHAFQRVILLGRIPRPGTILEIFDTNKQEVVLQGPTYDAHLSGGSTHGV